MEFEIHGSGDPAVLIQAPPFVTWYHPLVAHLTGRAALWYRRFSGVTGFGVEDDARLCARLLTHVRFVRPHVVGHSYGGIVALELRVSDRRMRRSRSRTRAGRTVGSARRQRAVATPQWPGRTAPWPPWSTSCAARAAGWNRRARTARTRGPSRRGDARGAFLRLRAPAAIRWSFAPADAGLVTCPILNLRGARSGPRFQDASATIQSWFPRAEPGVLDGASHLLMAQQPEAAARCLRRFWDQV